MNYTEILTSIRQVIRSVNIESKRTEKEYGVSIPQFLCLHYLQERTLRRATQKEIKDFLKLNASTVTGIISRLEKKGLVARLSPEKDKRVRLISITSKGTELLRLTPDSLPQSLSGKLRQLSAEQLGELRAALATITDFFAPQEPIYTDLPVSRSGEIVEKEA